MIKHFKIIDKKYRMYCSIAFLSMLMAIFSGCAKNDADELISEIEMPEIQDTISVGNDGEKAGIAKDTPDAVEVGLGAENAVDPSRLVTVTIEKTGRTDPFLPLAGGLDSLGYNITADMIVPPQAITTDAEATTIITTKVTGILYDKYKPSAIIQIEGSDYLVRVGDNINNYRVLSIDKNNVTVKLGANVYKAGVGELFSTEGMQHNTISNLESKFGSRKNR